MKISRKMIKYVWRGLREEAEEQEEEQEEIPEERIRDVALPEEERIQDVEVKDLEESK